MDRETGLVHHVEVTGANVHNMTGVPELLTGEETEVFGGRGYWGADKREGAITRYRLEKAIRYKLNRRPSQSKNSSVRSKGQIRRREREKSSIRAKVQHVFGVVKNLFHFRKTWYKGRRNQAAQLNMLVALANLYLADNHGLLARLGFPAERKRERAVSL